MTPQKIPVLLITETTTLPPPAEGDAVLILPANTNHGHADGSTCIACAAQTDIRALLYNLLIDAERGTKPKFERVIIDASAVTDATQVSKALTGQLPATALRDHTVAKRFYLQHIAGQ